MSRTPVTDIHTCASARLRDLLALGAGDLSGYGALLEQARRPDEIERLLADAWTLDQAQQALGDLSRPDTPLARLREVRGAAKKLIDGAASAAHREAAVFVYHAATAAALARHGINLSAVAPQSRLPLYEDLATALATHPIAETFCAAADYLIEVGPE